MWFLQKSSWIFRHRSFSSAGSTIFALSSGQGKCGVAVIRISGPKASEAILRMTKCLQLPKPRMALLHHIKDPVTHDELDKGLILWFPGPKSFTGEDCCEFQVHGGPAVIAALLSGLSKIPDFRPAEAGEFTKRAFFAGKLDLTEIEGLGDLIHAETELQRKQALYQMEGNLSSLYKKWREILLKNLAHIEAYIDFSEDDNIEDNVVQEANHNLLNLKKEIETHLSDGRKGERLRDGIRTTIIGEPNAGKSSLLNAFCQRPAAIVTPIPGTTRDIIEISLNINGFPLVLTDTAGLREDTSDVVEKEGIKRAHACLENSDLVLLIIDASKIAAALSSIPQLTFQDCLQNYMKSLNLNIAAEIILKNKISQSFPNYICIINKIDLLNPHQKSLLKKATENYHNINFISCKTEENLNLLLEEVTVLLKNLCANPSRESPSLTQSRHRHHLNKCVEFLNEYFLLIDQDITIAAQKLRLSLRHLGKIIGTVSSEEILDVIFKDFCIGK